MLFSAHEEMKIRSEVRSDEMSFICEKRISIEVVNEIYMVFKNDFVNRPLSFDAVKRTSIKG